ncbi:MAG: RNA-binding protein [Methanobacteriaceae archaeon]
MKIKKRYHLKKKKLKEVKKELGKYVSIIPDKSTVELVEAEPYPIILVDSKPYIILVDDKPFPTLKAILSIDINSTYLVTVDMGAVKFMANGADVMSPGIVAADDDIIEGDIVTIVDENNKQPLAIAIAKITGLEMVENTKGKACTTIHFIGDEIWNLEI